MIIRNFVLFLLAVLPALGKEVVLDLSGQEFGVGKDIHVNSGTQRLPASAAYEFALEGSVHGTGVLALLVPNGTTFEDLFKLVSPGASIPMNGVADNPTGKLPFAVINQAFSGPVTLPGVPVAVTVSFKIKGGVAANGAVHYDLSIGGVTGLPLLGSIVLEQGTKLRIKSLFDQFAGNFGGLIGSSTFHIANQGAVRTSVTLGGLVTASLKLGMKTYPLKTALSSNYKTPAIPIGRTGLSIELSVDVATPDEVHVRLLDANGEIGTSTLTRAAYFDGPPLTRAGCYTILLDPPALPGGSTPAEHPVGSGFMTAKITAGGNVTFTGLLCDGKPIAASAMIGANDSVAFFVPLLAGHGGVFGTLTLHGQSDPDDIDGALRWIKPGLLTEKVFGNGLDVMLSSRGSLYVKPDPGQRALLLTTCSFQLAAGNLAANADIAAVLEQKNTFTIAANTGLRVTLAPATGVLGGNYKPGPKLPAVMLKGAILQKQNTGGGFFLGLPGPGVPIQSGSLTLAP